jgi:hypothetical protein
MRLNLNVVETPRGVSGVREETIVYLPAEKTSPAFFRCTPAIACRVRRGAAFISHSPDTPLNFMTNSRAIAWVNSGVCLPTPRGIG